LECWGLLNPFHSSKHFVEVLAVGHLLVLSVPGLDVPNPSSNPNFTAALQKTISLQDSISVLQNMGTTFNVLGALSTISNSTESLLTAAYVFVYELILKLIAFAVLWTIIGNMILRAILQQMYDNHLYLSYVLRCSVTPKTGSE
jgi:hypothetical protein